MKFTSYQKIVLGYQTIVSMLRQRGFDTTLVEKELSNITEERVDEFLESFQTRKKQFGGADDSSKVDYGLSSESDSDGDGESSGSESSESESSGSDETDSDESESKKKLSLERIGDSVSYLDKATTDDMCSLLATNRIPKEQQVLKRKGIRDRLNKHLGKEVITLDNFESRVGPHLQDMFHLYDASFFNGRLSSLLSEKNCQLHICWNSKCYSVNGTCSLPDKDGCRDIKIEMSTKLFKEGIQELENQKKKGDHSAQLQVGYLSCQDTLSCVQLVFENQLVKGIVQCFCPEQLTVERKAALGDWWGRTAPVKKYSKTVMSVLNHTFGHEDYAPGLQKVISEAELAEKRRELDKKRVDVEARRKKTQEKKELREQSREKKSKKVKKAKTTKKTKKSEAKESLNLYAVPKSDASSSVHAHVLFVNKSADIAKAFSKVTSSEVSQYNNGDQVIIVMVNHDSQPVYLPDENVYEIERAIFETMGGTRVSIFHIEQIIRDLSRHQFVPKHIILTKEEAKKVIQKYQGQLPRLLAFQQDHNSADMMGRFLGLVPGQVIKIIRKSPTTCQSIAYRSVVGNIHDKS